MSRRRVGMVVLCEDQQQEVFCRRFLVNMGWNLRELRIESAPQGKGSAKQYVATQFPKELTAYRSNRNNINSKLIVMIDGDKDGVSLTIKNLEESCRKGLVDFRASDEAVSIFVPTWNIETWLAYLDGQTVDEGKRNYSRLDKPSLCQRHANALAEMCRIRELRNPAPESLRIACDEYQSRITEY